MTTETVLLTREKSQANIAKWTMGVCSMVEALRKCKVPEKHWEELMYVCHKHGGCLPCVLHKEVVK